MPGNPKQAMRVKFDAFPGMGHFAGKKVIKIDGMPADQSMMRERLAFFVFRTQVPTPREAAARLTVNGELRGHFTVIEVWDSESIEEQFPMPAGPLYRIRGLAPGGAAGGGRPVSVPRPRRRDLRALPVGAAHDERRPPVTTSSRCC